MEKYKEAVIFRNCNSILQGNRIDSVETMKHSENIYDSLFGWILFIWLFFTWLFPPVTFSQPGIFHVYVFTCPPERPDWPSPERVSNAPVLCASLSLLSSFFFKSPTFLSCIACLMSQPAIPVFPPACILGLHPGQGTGSPLVWCSRESHHHCKVALGINRLRAHL